MASTEYALVSGEMKNITTESISKPGSTLRDVCQALACRMRYGATVAAVKAGSSPELLVQRHEPGASIDGDVVTVPIGGMWVIPNTRQRIYR